LKKTGFVLLSLILVIFSLVLPRSTSANNTEGHQEALDLTNEGEFETPFIITDSYVDENGNFVTEYEYIDEVIYDNYGNILSVTEGEGFIQKPSLDTGDFQIMNSACTPIVRSKLISETLHTRNKKLGWHPDFPKNGNKNVKSFWFSNRTKNVSYSLGGGYGGASIGVSVSIGNGSGHSINNPHPSTAWVRPAVIANVHKRVTEFKRQSRCGLPAKTWRETTYVPKKVWYRADKVK
jgi:hypothetical protein